MTPSERIYRALLRAYPAATRRAYGDDMAQLFVDQLRDAPDRFERAAIWARAVADIVVDAPRDRVTSRRAVPVAEGPPIANGRPLAPDLLAAAVPLVLTSALLVVAPGFVAPLLDDRASLLGLPFGLTTAVGFSLLASLGIFSLRRGGASDARSRLLVAGVLAVPIPTIALMSGFEAAAWYAVAAAFLLAVVSFRWLSFAITFPLVLWLVLGPSIVLILLNTAGVIAE